MNTDKATLAKSLIAPFPDDDISFAPKQIRNGQAQVFAYVDAPTVIKRLNDTLGPFGWNWHAELEADGCVRGVLTIENVSKTGFGASNQSGLCPGDINLSADNLFKIGMAEPVEGGRDRINKLKKMIGDISRPIDASKAAESDALKRAAMKFGVGLELWTDWQSAWVPYEDGKIAISKASVIAKCKKGTIETFNAASASSETSAKQNKTSVSEEAGSIDLSSFLDDD